MNRITEAPIFMIYTASMALDSIISQKVRMPVNTVERLDEAKRNLDRAMHYIGTDLFRLLGKDIDNITDPLSCAMVQVDTAGLTFDELAQCQQIKLSVKEMRALKIIYGSECK